MNWHRLTLPARKAVYKWRAAHHNATCDLCHYTTHQPWLRHLIGWNACPACWEEGGVLIRYTKAGIS